MSLIQQTLKNIIYLQNIISYVDITPFELLNMKLVDPSWYECVTEYNNNTWFEIRLV
jgi:hypothetical protein